MLRMEQVASSSPGNVGYLSHVHKAYVYSGPFKFFGYIRLDTKIALKKKSCFSKLFS